MSNLCTLADVRTALELATGETGRDATITANLPAVDKAIAQYCNREFINSSPGGDGNPRKFHYFGGKRLTLSPYDAQSVSAVVMDTDTTSPITLTIVTDYYLEPLPASDGVFTHIYFTSLEPADLGGIDTRREVSVTGVWGFPTVPADVNRAAILTHLSWLDKAVSEYGGNAPNADGRALRPAAGAGLYIPPAARMILEDYARQGVA